MYRCLFSADQQLRQHLFQPARMHLLILHFGSFAQRLQQRKIGGPSRDAGVSQGSARAAQHILKTRCGAVNNELGQQAVVMG